MSDDILYEISKRLALDVVEYARFGCVSKTWKSSALYHRKSLTPCSPLLILAKRENDNQEDGEGVRSVYSVSTDKAFNLKLPQAQGRRCWGTSYSWLLTMGLDLNINLVNPLSHAQIPLPPQHTFEHQFKMAREPEELCCYFINKFALASNPSSWDTTSDSNQVVVSYGEYCSLAIAAPGDQVWTSFEEELGINADDIIFFRDRFYFVSYGGMLRICDTSTTPPKAFPFASPPDALADFAGKFYLVEVSGELHLVAKRWKCVYQDEDEDEDEYELRPFHHETEYFIVFKLDNQTREWTEVEDLGDHALFLGTNTSFSISTSNYPEFKASCIYFTDDNESVYEYGYCDMGVYDIKKDTVEPLWLSGGKISKFSRPVFFMPTLPSL